MSIKPDYITLDAVLNTLVDGAILIDRQGLIFKYNPACEKIFQYAPEEIVGRNISVLMPEPYREKHDGFIENYQKTRTAKIIGIGRKVEGLKKDGCVFPMHLSVGEVKRGSDISYIGIIRDLSEEEREHMRFEELQQAHFHLSRIAAMDQMATAIAHELNQPLAAVMNYLNAGSNLIHTPQRLDTQKLSVSLEKAKEQANRAGQILSGLRQFIERGQITKQPVSPVHLVESSLGLIRPFMKKTGVVVETEFAPSLPDLCVSDIQIQQVLVNLIKNACEAMADAPVKSLAINVDCHEGDVQFSIRDTGVGMTAAKRETLFQPFATDKRGGLGVGLSICHNIIKNHNGKIWVEKNVPKGAVFHILLPVSPLNLSEPDP